MKATFVGILVSLSLAAGCAGRQNGTTTVSSAKATGYAERYPSELSAAVEAVKSDEARAKEVTESLPTRTADLKAATDPELVLAIIEASDEAGRGSDYADAFKAERNVRTFFETERGPISSRANAAASQKMAEGKCENVEVGGVISYALKDGVDKQLEKRLRERNDAHLLIERGKGKMPNAQVTRLQELADDIALASHLVNVALVEDARDLDRRLGEHGKVKDTLEDAIEEEQKYGADAARSDPEKRASKTRLEALQKALSEMDAPKAEGEAQQKDLDKRIEQLQKDYEAAKKALEDELDNTADSPQEAGDTEG